jgi:hypothetical protein
MVKKYNPGIIMVDVLIIICVLALALAGYYEFRKKYNQDQNENQAQLTAEKDLANQSTLPANQANNANEHPSAATNQSANDGAKAPADTVAETTSTENITPGFYQNSTYFYSINYPPEWPIKERKATDVSIGVVPPKNGIGAITIEISQTSFETEFEQTKNEIKKYSFMELKETPYVIDGITGKKFSLSNAAINTTTVIITFEKNGLFYTFKYAEESEDFTKTVETALLSFKFIK